MNLKIIYHGNCFDGVASAAVFSNFYKARIYPNAEVTYSPAVHRAGNAFDREVLSGDENAIVDFKYCADSRLTWWFDHHQSAFLSPEDEAHFHSDKSGKKFLDVNSKSCAEFIARIARENFGFVDDLQKDLVHWAHIIDGALYTSPAQCVELKEPALKLMQVIENEKDPDYVEQIIRWMTEQPLQQILKNDSIQSKLGPIIENHWKTVDLIKKLAVFSRGVVYFDLIGTDIEAYNKFIPYYHFPEATYVVSLSRSSFRVKVSVGSNPWAPRPRRHNIAAICERYGGGGHAVVGAVSLSPDAVEDGRRIMREIIAELEFED